MHERRLHNHVEDRVLQGHVVLSSGKFEIYLLGNAEMRFPTLRVAIGIFKLLWNRLNFTLTNSIKERAKKIDNNRVGFCDYGS